MLLAIFAAGAAAECAVRLVNCLCTLLAKPRPIMRLDFSTGIPDDCRTLVAVPTMLTSAQAVRSLAENLEVRYLANQDGNLCFALVTDLPDAASETLPTDAALLECARHEIEKLNARYGGDAGRPSEAVGPFYLLHRPRKWNPQEEKWMGQERKRGKLAGLNRLLRGDASDFSVIVGAIDALSSTRYVITLDTDTQLPCGTARELVAAMAHPLNRPRIDKATRTVVAGHALLQPRVTTTMPEAQRSVFAQLFAGDAGVDPYTYQASDVYQDVFGEGSYIGKGIYDVDAFETVLRDRFPDNRVLSHDLIEGCFARCGLINDVELFEGFPARLPADMSRRHRWTRGDWQIAAWLCRRVPTASQAFAQSALAAGPLEDFRQPPPQLGAGVPVGLPAGGVVGGAGIGRRLPVGRDRGRVAPRAAGHAARHGSASRPRSRGACTSAIGRPTHAGSSAARRSAGPRCHIRPTAIWTRLSGRFTACAFRGGSCWNGRPPAKPSTTACGPAADIIVHSGLARRPARWPPPGWQLSRRRRCCRLGRSWPPGWPHRFWRGGYRRFVRRNRPG